MATIVEDDPVKEVEASDVIQLMLQFCKENRLTETAKVLQTESGVILNTVDSIESFVNEVKSGQWDVVLRTVSTLKLPPTKLVDLYEHIVIELIEIRELETARSILRQTNPMLWIKDAEPERYLRLEHLLASPYFEKAEAYSGQSKERRRAAIGRTLSAEVTVVPPSRLLFLLGQSLKFQQSQGLLAKGQAYDLFKGKVIEEYVAEEDSIVRTLAKTFRMGEKSHAECAEFSIDGQYLATGSVDGFIEVWNWKTGKINTSLQYQKDDEFMTHETSILCLAWSPDSNYIASGSQDGQVKVWHIKTGKCVRKFEKAHSEGVTCCSFGKEGVAKTQIITGSFDMTIRIHGLKSGKTLKIFRGHQSYVNQVLFLGDGKVISGSSDGTCKLWDPKTTECLQTIRSNQVDSIQENTINSLSVDIRHPNEQFLVCMKSPIMLLMNTKGQVLKSFDNGKKEGGDFISACFSPQGEFIFAVSEDNKLYSFNTASGKEEHCFEAHQEEIIGITHHPQLNLVVTYSLDDTLKSWKA